MLDGNPRIDENNATMRHRQQTYLVGTMDDGKGCREQDNSDKAAVDHGECDC